MWIVIKYKTNNLGLLTKELNKKFNSKIIYYLPKIQTLKNSLNNGKIIKKDFKILGDYILCYHPSFSNKSILNEITNTKGVKCFLKGYLSCQREIQEFISKCKNNEDENGYLNEERRDFFKFKS